MHGRPRRFLNVDKPSVGRSAHFDVIASTESSMLGKECAPELCSRAVSAQLCCMPSTGQQQCMHATCLPGDKAIIEETTSQVQKAWSAYPGCVNLLQAWR